MKMRKFIGKALSGISMIVTFGAFGTANAQTENYSQLTTAPAVELKSQVQLNSLKQKIQADYRDNIARYESQNHAG